VGVTVDWLGTATFRLTVDDTVLFLDAYVDRVPAAPPVGLRVEDVERADAVLVGHSHFDHLWGADRIATQTGATVLGSYESVRMLVDAGVPQDQLVAVQGGEPVQVADDVRVRVFPSLHTCLWCMPEGGGTDPTITCSGDLGVEHRARERITAATLAPWATDPDVLAHLTSGPHARGDGGALVYLVETRHGSVLWQDSAGCWTPVLGTLRPDVALLAAVGRPNRDGEPYQGSLVEFVADEIASLGAHRVALCHHDDWMPPVTDELPTEPFAAEFSRRGLPVELLDLEYLDGRKVL
jgi:L-ascorbate metabolism protein UlaG (beta-lactamase superfamily)